MIATAAVPDVDDDRVATGRLAGPARFMGLRAQRNPRARRVRRGDDLAAVTTSVTELHPHRWAGNRAAAAAIGQRLQPGVHTLYRSDTASTGTQWLYDPDSGSWATVGITASSPPYPVEQAGSRMLFDEVATAYRWWLDVGSPASDRWQIVIDRRGQHIRLTTT